jgi:hypothetical protein
MSGVFYYTFIRGFVFGGINYFVHGYNSRGKLEEKLLKVLFSTKILKSVLAIILAIVISGIAGNFAYKLVDNPSYVSFLSNLEILWIYFLSRFMHIKDMISPVKGVILALYTISFILLTY